METKKITMFKNYTELNKEINKREYNNIEGFKSPLTKKEYWYFLEVLPPLRFDGVNFYLMEFLTGNLTFYISREGKKYFIEVKQLNKTREEWGMF